MMQPSRARTHACSTYMRTVPLCAKAANVQRHAPSAHTKDARPCMHTCCTWPGAGWAGSHLSPPGRTDHVRTRALATFHLCQCVFLNNTHGCTRSCDLLDQKYLPRHLFYALVQQQQQSFPQGTRYPTYRLGIKTANVAPWRTLATARPCLSQTLGSLDFQEGRSHQLLVSSMCLAQWSLPFVGACPAACLIAVLRLFCRLSCRLFQYCS